MLFLLRELISKVSKINANQKKSEADIIAEQLVAQKGSAEAAEYFKISFEDYKSETKKWLNYTTICLLVIISASLFFDPAYRSLNSLPDLLKCSCNFFIPNLNTKQYLGCLDFTPPSTSLQNELSSYMFISTKVICFASLYFALFFSIKNYNTSKYNQIANEYKFSLLKALDLIFIEYPNDKRELYLDKLADYLFTEPVNPYTKNSASGMPYEKVLDLLSKAIGKSKEGG